MLLLELFEDIDEPEGTYIESIGAYDYYIEDNDTIQVFHNGALAGTLYFDRHPDTNKYVGSVEVEIEHQRKGLAKNLYDIAEKVVGERFVPDIPHTKDGEAFWRNRIGDINYDTYKQSIS